MARTRRHGTIARETGMALATLAVWMLCLLAPLHQSAGALREMDRAGVDISGAWSICVTLAEGDTATDKAVPGCLAHGVAKTGLALTPAAVSVAAVWELTGVVDRSPRATRQIGHNRIGRIQPRAPLSRSEPTDIATPRGLTPAACRISQTSGAVPPPRFRPVRSFMP